MRLSQPQKRVLRTMADSGHPLYGHSWGGKWHIFGNFRFQHRTIQVLENHGLLRKDPQGLAVVFEYHLTPKGRDVAKELEDEAE